MFYSWSTERPSRINDCRLYRGAAVAAVAVLAEPRPTLDQPGGGSRRGTPLAGALSPPTEGASFRHRGQGADGRGSVDGRAPDKPAELSVLVVGGDDTDRGSHSALTHHSVLSTQASFKGSRPADNPSAVLHMVERSHAQSELTLGADSLCALATMPAARLASVGSGSSRFIQLVCERL